MEYKSACSSCTTIGYLVKNFILQLFYSIMADTIEPIIQALIKEDKKHCANTNNIYKLNAILMFIQDQNQTIRHFLYYAFVNPQHSNLKNLLISSAKLQKQYIAIYNLIYSVSPPRPPIKKGLIYNQIRYEKKMQY